MPAAHERVCHDAPSISKPPYQLMAENQRWAPKRAVPQKSRNVGATDACNFDRNFLLSILRLGPRTFLEFNLTGSCVDQSSHRQKV